MTYPFKGQHIYRSQSLRNIAKKCYGEYKKMDNMQEGLFGITNLDKSIEYVFRVSNKRIRTSPHLGGVSHVIWDGSVHKGGNLQDQVNYVMKIDGEKNACAINKPDEQYGKMVNTLSQNINKNNEMTSKKIDIISQNVVANSEKVDEIIGKLDKPQPKSQSNLPPKLPPKPETKQQPQLKPEQKCDDVFYGLDVYDENILKLKTIQNLQRLDKEPNYCVLF